jgi:hypothetical protein
MNHRREAGKFQTAGSNHTHPKPVVVNPPQQQAQLSQPSVSSKSVFVEKELPRKKKKFTRE